MRLDWIGWMQRWTDGYTMIILLELVTYCAMSNKL